MVPCNTKILENNFILTWNHGFRLRSFTDRWRFVCCVLSLRQWCTQDFIFGGIKFKSPRLGTCRVKIAIPSLWGTIHGNFWGYKSVYIPLGTPVLCQGRNHVFKVGGVQFLGLDYCTEHNTDGITSFVHFYVKSWGDPSNFWGVRTPPTLPVVAPLCSARILFPPVMLTGGVRQVRWFVGRTASWCGFDRRQRLRTAGGQPAIRPAGLGPTGAQLVTPALLLYRRRRRCLPATAIKARRAITITARSLADARLASETSVAGRGN